MVPAVRNGSCASPATGRTTSRLSDLFDGFFRGELLAPVPTGWVTAPLSMWENEQNYFVELDAPGVKEEDLDVSVHQGELHIRGERKCTRQGESFDNRRYGNFEQRIQLPSQVNAEQVEARLEFGVLTITLPKSEQAKPRKISLKAK